MKNHMPSSFKKFNGLSTRFISRNVSRQILKYFFLNVHNAILNVRYIVFTHTKRYQCAFVCTPIFCIITLSHYLRKIEYVHTVHSFLEFQPNTHLTLSPLFRPLHKNSFLYNIRTQNQVRKGIWWQLSSFLSNMDTCIPKSSNSSRGYDYNLFQSSNEDEGIIRGREL